MYYAVKSVDNREINKIYTEWRGENGCMNVILHHSAVYKSFEKREEAEKFLNKASIVSVNAQVIDISKTSFSGKFSKKRFVTDNGYSVCVYRTVDNKVITCCGYNLPTNSKLKYNFSGKFVNTKKYGWQFQVESFKEFVTLSEKSIIEFLSSGIIKGLGKKKAAAIYEKFGDKSIEVIKNEPDRLAYVKGFSLKSALEIGEKFKEAAGVKDITMELMPFGISPQIAMKLYKQFGMESIKRVRKNPYLLCQFNSISFDDADQFGKKIGIAPDAEVRMKALCLDILKKNEESGDTGMYLNDYGYQFLKRADSAVVTGEKINAFTIKMIKDGLIKCIKKDVDGKMKQFLFLRSLYDIELECAMRLVELSKQKGLKEQDVDYLFRNRIKGVKVLNEKQEQASRNALLYGLSILTGGPGTGKTTVIRDIATKYRMSCDGELVFLAPTGRAARKMEEATGIKASTIHSFLKIREDGISNEEDPVLIHNALVVVDEFSMTDTKILHALLKSIKEGCNVLFVGDTDQLESVGCGAVLRDIIESNVFIVTRLTQVYRQEDGTVISDNIKKIQKGDTAICEGTDFHITQTKSLENVRNMIADLYRQRVNEYGVQEVYCLCPFRKGAAGVEDMNCLLQAVVNPKMENKVDIKIHEYHYRIGDPIMYLRNDDIASNGDIGIIEDISIDEEGYYKIRTCFNKMPTVLTKDNAEDFELAYAMTVHKSQGGEVKSVIFCIHEIHSPMLYRNLPYVAVSRAKEVFDMVGSKDAFIKAISNINKKRRITNLKGLIQQEAGMFVKMK